MTLCKYRVESMIMTNKNDNKLDDRFDLRADAFTLERLAQLSKESGLTKSEVVRRLIKNANMDDLSNAE